MLLGGDGDEFVLPMPPTTVALKSDPRCSAYFHAADESDNDDDSDSSEWFLDPGSFEVIPPLYEESEASTAET